jgi:two-component system, NarL family, nitrate/nitrite response regulator NarL
LLLADRQPLLNYALEALLTSDGAHDVLARCTPQDNIPQEVRRLQPDLLLLDADVAMSGRPTVLERALAARPGLKVLLLVLDMDVELLLDGMDAGAVGVVLKTSGSSTVRTAVESALGGEGFVPQATLPRVFRHLDAQHRAGESLVHRLSVREREVLALLGQGWSNEAIGEVLFISPHTVRTHIQNILEKLGFHSRLEAATFAMERASELPTAPGDAPKGTG